MFVFPNAFLGVLLNMIVKESQIFLIGCTSTCMLLSWRILLGRGGAGMGWDSLVSVWGGVGQRWEAVCGCHGLETFDFSEKSKVIFHSF